MRDMDEAIGEAEAERITRLHYWEAKDGDTAITMLVDTTLSALYAQLDGMSDDNASLLSELDVDEHKLEDAFERLSDTLKSKITTTARDWATREVKPTLYMLVKVQTMDMVVMRTTSREELIDELNNRGLAPAIISRDGITDLGEGDDGQTYYLVVTK